MRTQVGIVGAGPAGLLLAQLLARQGIESIIVENRTQAYCESRIRAGVLEGGTVDALMAAGVGDRLQREGMRHDGIYLQWPGQRRHLDFRELCGGSVWVYGQTEVTKDLFRARQEQGQQIFFEVTGTAIHDIESPTPRITFTDGEGQEQFIECDFVAGCDGFHGISRSTIPPAHQQLWERVYPYSWLGILADVPPSTGELIYAWHPDGFAMHSMRSAQVSRLYIQVGNDARVEDWPDERVWEALATRMALDGWTLREGPVTDKGITPMRSFVSAPMRHGRLFLAGDSAHIVPPTGAKGLNLAILDVARLDEAISAYYASGSMSLLDAYSADALARVWRYTHFSWWMTSMLHLDDPTDANAEFTRELQLSQLRYVTSSRDAGASLAENYTGAVR